MNSLTPGQSNKTNQGPFHITPEKNPALDKIVNTACKSLLLTMLGK